MSYSTGSATDRDDLLVKLMNFAVLNGWTVNRHDSEGAGVRVNLQKTGNTGTLFANLRSMSNEDPVPSSSVILGLPVTTGVVLSMSDSYDAAKSVTNQPGAPVSSQDAGNYYGTRIATISGSVPIYWMFGFANPEMIACVIQLPSGEFQHLLFGEILKTDLFTGGAFMYGSCGMADPYPGSGYRRLPFEFSVAHNAQGVGTSWLRANLDGRNGWWTEDTDYLLRGGSSTNVYPAGWLAGANFPDDCLIQNSVNAFNNLTCLIPVHLYARLTSGLFQPVGYLPHLRTCKATNFVPGETYSLGSDNWKVFPSKTQADGYGIAYRYAP